MFLGGKSDQIIRDDGRGVSHIAHIILDLSIHDSSLDQDSGSFGDILKHGIPEAGSENSNVVPIGFHLARKIKCGN